MPVTQSQLDYFHAFAGEMIAERKVDSLSDCLKAWEEQTAESIEAIKEGLADIEAGNTQPLDEAVAQIRQELGLPERNSIT